MAKKFIPNGDWDFLNMAKSFRVSVVREPGRFGVSEDDARSLDAAVTAFEAAHHANSQRQMRSPITVMEKESARKSAEAIIRRLAAGIRAMPAMDSGVLELVGMRPRAKAGASAELPNESPWLTFKRAVHENNAVPEHVLECCAQSGKSRPPGAVRVELFVDLIPPEVKAADHYRPGVSVRPIYVRSFTKSVIKLVPPMADVPMRVVYFARWADAEGNVGPMSTAVEGWVEGGKHHLMAWEAGTTYQPILRIDVSPETQQRDATVLVAMITGQTAKRTAMIEQQAVRQLEGPVEADAA